MRDFNYDGFVDISDLGLLSVNWDQNVVNRGGLPPRADLYIAMLDYPEIYWSMRDWTDFWNEYFVIFDSMDLGTIPTRPESMRAIPEPAVGFAACLAVNLLRRRRA